MGRSKHYQTIYTLIKLTLKHNTTTIQNTQKCIGCWIKYFWHESIIYFLTFQKFRLIVAWSVSETNPAASKFDWTKECTITNARTGTSDTKSTNTLTENLDFGQNYQDGDGLTTKCELKQSPKNFRTTSVISEATSSDTMSASDKTVTLTFTPFLVNVVVTSLTIPHTNPDPSTHTWTKSCSATTTRSGVTLDAIEKEVAESITSIDFGKVFFKGDSIVLLCNLKQTFGGSTSTLTAAAVTQTVTIPDAQTKNVAMNYNIFMVIFNHFCSLGHIHNAHFAYFSFSTI